MSGYLFEKWYHHGSIYLPKVRSCFEFINPARKSLMKNFVDRFQNIF